VPQIRPLLRHPQLVDTWTPPNAPLRYPDLTIIKVLLDSGHRWQLDFTRYDKGQRWFASDADKCPAIEWPWKDSFSPSGQDWKAIGFTVFEELRVRPSTPAEDARADEMLTFLSEVTEDYEKKHSTIH
jgi:hypothetical protein